MMHVCTYKYIVHMEAATTKSGTYNSTHMHALITPWDTDKIMLYGGYIGMYASCISKLRCMLRM